MSTLVTRRSSEPAADPELPEPNYFPDDDDYVEYTVDRAAFDAVYDSEPRDSWYAEPDEPLTSPIPVHVDPVPSRPGRHYREDDDATDPGVYGLHSM